MKLPVIEPLLPDASKLSTRKPTQAMTWYSAFTPFPVNVSYTGNMSTVPSRAVIASSILREFHFAPVFEK